MNVFINPFSGLIDFTGDSGSGSLIIPEVQVDPSSPSIGQPWILATPVVPPVVELTALYGAMPLTQDDSVYQYQFSVYTSSGTKRVLLT